MKQNIKILLKKLLFGITIPQEYVCLPYEGATALSVYVTSPKQPGFFDVTRSHIFLGYKPVIIALHDQIDNEFNKWLAHQNEVCLSFNQNKFYPDAYWEGCPTSRLSIARLKLRRIQEKDLNGSHVIFFEGVKGKQRFLSSFHQLTNDLLTRYSKKKSQGNIYLDDNLYEQVRIAYSVPRKISIISLMNNAGMNMFPTDLHGEVNNRFYISSLRIGGQANNQVEEIRTICISEIQIEGFKEVYELGKNHMQGLRRHEEFSLAPTISEKLGIPLHPLATSYKELRQMESFDIGIHRIHIYEIVNEAKITVNDTLAHIHNYYAQWLLSQGVKIKIFLR